LLAACRRQGRVLVRERLRRGIAERGLPAHADAGAMGAFCTAIVSSLSLEAHDGATEADLTAIINGALPVWPGYTQT